MKNKTEYLIPDAYYHVYNRANGFEVLFRNTDNYHYFFNKYREYISPVAETFAYCLMPNHFHFLIGIKEEKVITEYMNEKKKNFEPNINIQDISRFISQQFSHLFNGYTQAFNKQFNRRGSLFMQSFKRKRIEDESYLKNILIYIHLNPVVAGLCHQPDEWKFSSYQSIVSNKNDETTEKQVIDWFDDLDNFIFCHR